MLQTPQLSVRDLSDLCLAHLAADPERLAAFMAATGYAPEGLRQAVGGSALAHALIDYFAADEPLLLALCGEARLQPERFMRVWRQLNPAG